ncbi:MAG: chemotaxis response regulator protein-glutamate methylesterase [Thermogutta sp.]|nr:chemotaxis response regulator protein-glutamate methylesterase [Thermogutta sp.]
MAKTVRVLIVDDSIVMRQMIKDFLVTAPGIQVVGMASNGREALRLADELAPDVITLDIEMPGMDGLSTLDTLLAKRPIAVIMVSSLTQAGAAITLDALERGAIDYLTKPAHKSEAATVFGQELIRKIRFAATSDVNRIVRLRKQRAQSLRMAEPVVKSPTESLEGPPTLSRACIAIGISTGGPPALTSLFRELKPPLPPILVVQHMPPQFTKPFAWRLNSVSRLTVKEAESGDLVKPNHAYVAPGGFHMAVQGRSGSARIRIFDGEPVSGHKPSVDVMMSSVAQVFGRRVLGVIMTGMGRDGANGCRAIRAAGGYVLGQDEATSDVYGMNKVAFVEGNVDRQFPLQEGARLIMRYVEEKFLAQPSEIC